MSSIAEKIKKLIVNNGGTPPASASIVDNLKCLVECKGGARPEKDSLSACLESLCACAGGGSSEGGNDTLKQLIEGTLTEISDDSVESIRKKAFENMATLERVSFGNVTEIYEGAFYGCKNLEYINFPNVTKFNGNYPFGHCIKLESVYFPKPITSAFVYTFDGCTNLKIADFSCSNINTYAFRDCKSLKTIINRCESRANLSSTTNFSNTPFAEGGTGGTMYVPQALIEEYQNATNWSILYAAGTCNFVAIEGSEYE